MLAAIVHRWLRWILICRHHGGGRRTSGPRLRQLLPVLPAGGRWLAEVAAHDPALDAAWFDAYYPLRQIGAQFPPTFVVHGREDTDVPCSESEDLAARLAQMGVAHRLIIEDGAGHGLARVPAERVAAIETEAANFLLVRLSR